MQRNNQVKLLSMLTGILLFSGFIQSYAIADATNNTGNAGNGAKVWADNCARCHNYRTPTEFSAQQSQVVMQHMRIQAGLTGQEARDAYAFLAEQTSHEQTTTSTLQDESKSTENNDNKASPTSTLPTKKPAVSAEKPTQQVSNGKTIYKQTCIACHGSNGKGAIPGVPDFTNKSGPLSKSDSILLRHTINGFQSPGSPMAMPPKGGNPKLSNADLQNVLTYIRQTFR